MKFKKSMFAVGSLLMVIIVLGAPIRNAYSQPDPAREVVDSYLGAQHRSDWAAMGSYIDPADLSKFKTMLQAKVLNLPSMMDTSVIRPSYFGVKSLSEVGSVDSIRYFAGMMSVIVEIYPPMRQMLINSENKILGSVAEGADMKHFVCRVNASVDKESVSSVEIVSVHRKNGKWYIVGKRNVEQLAGLMQRAIR